MHKPNVKGHAKPGKAPTLSDRIKGRVKSAAKRLVPESVVLEVQEYRAYPKIERLLYLKIRTSNHLGITNPRNSRVPGNARSFVFVCFGNIMRSPMCEALMNRAAQSFPDATFRVTSAGLNAIPGSLAHPWAVAEAGKMGISLEHHRSRLLTREMADQADVIFAMDYQNQVQLLSRWGHAAKKVFMLSAYAGECYRPIEIRDPYYLGPEGTLACYQILDTCIQNLLRSLSQPSHAATCDNIQRS